MHDGRKGWEVDGKREASDGGDGAGESLEELLLADVKHVWREGVAVVVNLRNAHSVGEGRDVEHVQEGSLGSSDLGTGRDKLEISGNFDRTTGNLGWDTKSLEERSLSGLHAGVTSWDEDVIWCDSASSGWGGNLVGKDLVADILQVGVGEDESNVALDEWKKALPLWRVTNEPLDGTANLENCLAVIYMVLLSQLSYHGVLSHQDNTLSAERLSDLVHLLGADIVDGDNEDAAILLEKALQLIEIAGLVCGLAPHIFLV